MKKPIRVLLVDDDADVLDSFLEEIVSSGPDYMVTTANDGKKALDIIISGERFDVIITDQQMTEFNGLQLIREIRLNKDSEIYNTPIILMSGDSKFESDANEHGVDFLLKGSGDSIKETIENALMNKEA